MSLSTFGKPRVIGCAEEFPRHIALPRGCLNDLEGFLASHKIALELQDERYAGTAYLIEFHGTLQPPQEKAVREMLQFDNGVLVAPTGFGKTVIAARLIAERKTNAVILVHRKSLLDQWREHCTRKEDIEAMNTFIDQECSLWVEWAIKDGAE